MVQASICYGTDLSYVLCTHIVGKVTCLFLSFGVRQGGILSPRLVTIMFTLTSSSPDCRESRLHACLEKQFGLKFVMQMIIIVFIVTSSSTLQIYKTFASGIVSILTRCIWFAFVSTNHFLYLFYSFGGRADPHSSWRTCHSQ